MCRSIAEAVLAHGRKQPGKLAVADPERTYSYGELAKAAVIAAGVLHDRSVERGDYVLVECTQKAEFLILDLACELLGAVFVPLEKKMTEATSGKIRFEKKKELYYVDKELTDQ